MSRRGDGTLYLRGKTWWVEVWQDGERVRRSTGTADKAEAERFRRRLVGEMSVTKLPPTKVTVGDLLTLLVVDYRTRGLRDLKNVERRVELHLRPALGTVRVADWRASHLQRFISRRKANGAALASINNEIAALSRAFTLGRQNDLVFIQPAFPKLATDNARQGLCSPEQYEALKAALPSYARLALVLGYHTGMRLGEIANLEWPDVGLHRIVIRAGKAKSKRGREVPVYGEMASELEAAFRDRDPQCPYVVQCRGRRAYWMLGYVWGQTRDRLGIDVRIHDLRRTAASNMVAAGIPEYEIMRILGWQSPAMLSRYFMRDPRLAARVGERMQNFLWANIPPQAPPQGVVK